MYKSNGTGAARNTSVCSSLTRRSRFLQELDGFLETFLKGKVPEVAFTTSGDELNFT